MKDLFHVEISEEDGLPQLKYRFLKQAWQRLERTLLGKTILFTDNDDWSDAEIVRGYRNQHHVESASRDMKNPYHLCLRPQRHWTDQKIAVDVFYCVLALTLCTLLRRELYRKGVDRSIETMLEELTQIREVAVVYPPKAKSDQPIIEMTTSQMSDNQRALYDALPLKRHLAG